MLSLLSDEEVQEFMREFYRKLVELNRWDLWAAGYVICGGMSDDSFHYFRSWIIGKGRQCYETALLNPSSLVPFLDDPEVDNELLEYVALEVLEGRGIEDDPRAELEGDADGEPSGEPFDEETVDELYPALAEFAGQS